MIELSKLVIKSVDGSCAHTHVTYESDDGEVRLDNVKRIEFMPNGGVCLVFDRVEYHGPEVKAIVADDLEYEPVKRFPPVTLDEFINR